MQSSTVALHPFEPRHGRLILGWIASPEELWHWAARRDFPLHDTEVFSHWHADPDITPFELLVDGELLGYGETWWEPEEPWAELGRLIIAPARRNRGYGELLVRNLAEQVRRSGFADAWVRVCSKNRTAVSCYQRAGFIRVSRSRELELNANQSHEYAWLHLDGGLNPKSRASR